MLDIRNRGKKNNESHVMQEMDTKEEDSTKLVQTGTALSLLCFCQESWILRRVLLTFIYPGILFVCIIFKFINIEYRELSLNAVYWDFALIGNGLSNG